MSPRKTNSNGLEAIARTYSEYHARRSEEMLRQGLEARRKIFVYEIAERISKRQRGSAAGILDYSNSTDIAWIPIESLSNLRATVGGRFQQLKERWVAAGLPLREHRGDRSAGAAIDRDGWIELTNWMLKQGFEARLIGDHVAGGESQVLFQVKKLSE